MKKFLTVLLVIAVMFTFSFGSAFAATAQEEFADKYSATIGDQYFESLWAEIVKVTTDSDALTLYKEYEVDKVVFANFKAEVKALYDEYMTEAATDYVETTDAILTIVGIGVADADLTTEQTALLRAIAHAQFTADKEDALAVLATVPVYNYSDEVMSAADATAAQKLTGGSVLFEEKGYTYKVAAGMLVDYFKGEVEDCDDFNADATITTYMKAAAKAGEVVEGAVLPMGYATYDKDDQVTAMALTGAYDLQIAYLDAAKAPKAAAENGVFPASVSDGIFLDVNNDTNQWSAAAVETADKIEAANEAAVKAQNAADYAAYVTAYPSKVKYADKWLKVADILAEAGYTASQIANPDGTVYADKADAMANLEYWAARYAAEKNADGVLIRDAALVQKYLEEGLTKIAKAEDAKLEETSAAAVAKVRDNTKSAAVAADLAFVKESIKTAAAELVADWTEDEVFYAKELAKVQGYVDTYMAKVAAAANQTEATAAYTTMLSKIDDVKTAAKLDEEWTTAMTEKSASAAAADVLYDAAVAYVKYYNTNISVTSTGADLNDTVLKARIAEMIGESGFRTTAEIKTLKEKAVEVAQGLPTNDEVKAAKKALEAAIKALPAKATIADFAAVQAVSDAIEAYEDVAGTNDVTLTAYNTAVAQIVAAYNAQYAQQAATVSKTDEAAIKAIRSDIWATMVALGDLEGVEANTTYMSTLRSTLYGYLQEIWEAEYDAVVKAIKAIPINVTEADKAVVVAARELYDAYVAKHTDGDYVYDNTTVDFAKNAYTAPENYLGGQVSVENEDVLFAAETVLGLNVEDAAYSVEALKITASSKATKGAITVKWSVEGDTDAVEGYEIWKSTKKNSGYKKAFTATKMSYKNTKGLKKGTRYFYKVRAIAYTEEGVKVKSDWSNKAYRVAK